MNTTILVCLLWAASWIIFAFVKWLQGHKRRHIHNQYHAAVAIANVRPASPVVIPEDYGQLLDDCLRRGYDLPASTWIVNRTGELAGDLLLAEQEWAQLRQ